jgi:hypothetical protein
LVHLVQAAWVESQLGWMEAQLEGAAQSVQLEEVV